MPLLAGPSAPMLLVRSYERHHALPMPASTAPPCFDDAAAALEPGALPLLPDEGAAAVAVACCWMYFLYCQAMRSSACDSSSPSSPSSSCLAEDVAAAAAAGRKRPGPPLGSWAATQATFWPTATPSAMKYRSRFKCMRECAS